MSWARVYGVALHLLPARLREKHGRAMEALFARELAQARAQGWLHGALAGVAGLWDVVRRGAYERRPVADPGRQPMPRPTTRQLLGRLAASLGRGEDVPAGLELRVDLRGGLSARPDR